MDFQWLWIYGLKIEITYKKKSDAIPITVWLSLSNDELYGISPN
jgi:hypothetical protein